MNTPPISLSTWQIALAGIAFVSICILVQSVRRWRMTDSLVMLVISALSLALLYGTLMIQSYTGLTNNVPVARVQATTVVNSPNGEPALSVEMTLYDQDGQPTSDKTYLILGNEWMVQADIVKVSGLLGMAGLHSGCKLTRLEGRFDDPRLEANAKHSVVTLNGGDDSFFQWSRLLNSVLSPFVDAEYGNAVIDGPGTYLIYRSQSGLWAKGV